MAEGDSILKLEGGSRKPLNNQVLSPVVIQNDASAVPNTVKLNGSNYPIWSKVLEMYIARRGRKGFVTGSTKEPVEDSIEYETWETGNAIVKGWLINSMEPAIMGFFIHLRPTKEVWEEVARTYYDGSDISQIYELKVKSFRLRQEGQPVGVYYADLKSVWQELDQRRPIKMECAADLKTLREEIQIDRVYAFLAGLDDIFDKKLRAKDRGTVGSNGGRASLAAATPTAQKVRASSGDPSHTLLTRATPGDSSSNTGIVGRVLLASESDPHTGWILDSGATDHMTYDKTLFQYMTMSHRKSIATANGTLVPVYGAGTDIQTKEIIGRGTKREGLYYVDDVVSGRANAVRASHASSFMNKRYVPFELVHSNVWGPSPVVLPSGIKWFVTFVDDCTRMTWLYVLKNKSDVGLVFRSFSQMIQTQYSSVIKVLRFDNGGEYIACELSEFLRDRGILYETTCPYTPQQNGVAERKNCHILETTRALLLGASVPKMFWPEAVTYVVYVINRMPSRVLNFQTPLQVLTQYAPVVPTHTLTPRGSAMSEQVYEEHETAVSEQSKQGSAAPIQQTAECFAEPGRQLQQTHTESVNVLSPLSNSKVPSNESSLNTPEVSIVDDYVINTSDNVNVYRLPPRQNRGVPPDRFSPEGKVKYPIANYVSCGGLALERQTLVNNMDSIKVPTRVEEALKDPKWTQAMDEEMLALQKNNTWEVTCLPKEKKTVGCRWVFTIKYKADGSIDRYKARFTQVMKKNGYHQSHSDHTLFVKRRKGKVTALIIYVDDMIITGDDQVARSSRGIFLSQRKYVLDLLKETGMLGCKPADTPIVEKHNLHLDPDQKPVDKGRYQRLVGRLIYLAHTRPDIAYAVSVVSQFMHSPSVDHMTAVMRILAYLKSAPGKGVLYRKHGHLIIEGFTDADWAGNVSDRRSTSGYFTFVGGNLVTWRSKKQKVVSRSSAEAEYRGMAHGICEILWLRKLLWSLGVKSKETMKLYCDNKSARDIADNPVQHDRTKHVEVDRHFIKEKLEKKIVSIAFVNLEEQLADVLTHVDATARSLQI
nr:uncharacterized protein LOC114823160 [Malus domestica]